MDFHAFITVQYLCKFNVRGIRDTKFRHRPCPWTGEWWLSKLGCSGNTIRVILQRPTSDGHTVLDKALYANRMARLLWPRLWASDVTNFGKGTNFSKSAKFSNVDSLGNVTNSGYVVVRHPLTGDDVRYCDLNVKLRAHKKPKISNLS